MTGQRLMEGAETAETARRTARRTFLAGVGALTTVLIAGCSGDEETNDPASDPTPDGQSDTNETRESEAADAPAQIEANRATLEQRAREFLTQQAEGSFDAAHERLTASTAAEFSVTAMTDSWQRIVSVSGAFDAVIESEYQETNDEAAVVTVETNFVRAKNTFRIVLTENGVRAYELSAQEPHSWEEPAYADTSAFAETTTTLGATESCDLGATLSVPEGDRKLPGVVVVHGSGPVDRDGTFGPNKPYKELAWGLASRGVAVLRYDKRTNACAVDRSNVTVDDATTDDALTAVEQLRAHDRVAADSVFVVGHSIGGALAPRIAARDGRLAGAVMLAPGPVRPIAETVLDQEQYLIEQQDLPEQKRKEALAKARARAEKIRSLDIGDDEVLLGLGGREYFRSLAEYDGPASAADREIPLFVGQGDRDYQVTVEDDFAIWREALSGKPAVRFEVYDGLNHLFQDGTGPSTGTEYYRPGAVFDRRVVEDIAEFVEANS
jgi:dienelactone hydrolase